MPARPGAQRGKLSRLKRERTRTRDGVEIHLFANAELPADIAQARTCGAAGVGLYRTEFLFLQRNELPAKRNSSSPIAISCSAWAACR